MELEVADRVHLAPMGYEIKRVLDPAFRLRADKVVIVGHFEHGEDGKKCRSAVMEGLEKEGIETEQIECNIFDFYDALGTFGDLIHTYGRDDVFVNVSTGSKVTAIAGMVSCMIAGATPYYARAHDYSEDTPSDIGEITKLPDYPIDPPKAEQVQILDYLSSNKDDPPTKGDLINFAENSRLEFITESNVQEKGKYRKIDTHIVDPLSERGYITVKKSGRSKIIKITEEGENAVRAFQYLIDSSQQSITEATASD